MSGHGGSRDGSGRKRKPEALPVVSKSNPWTIAGGSTSALNDNVGAISAGGSAERTAGNAGEGASGSALIEREPAAGGAGEGAGGSAERAAGNAGGSAFADWRSLKWAALHAIAEQAQQLRTAIEEAGAEQRLLFALQMHEQEQRMQARFDSARRSIAAEIETLRDARRTLASTHNWIAYRYYQSDTERAGRNMTLSKILMRSSLADKTFAMLVWVSFNSPPAHQFDMSLFVRER